MEEYMPLKFFEDITDSASTMLDKVIIPTYHLLRRGKP